MIFLLLAAASSGWAQILNRFTSWTDLMAQSTDIIIARCTAAEDSLKPKPIIMYSGSFNADIEVLAVLKGSTNAGPSTLATGAFFPYRGECCLIFVNYMNHSNYSGTNRVGYVANEDYRVVPISRFLNLRDLDGKSLDEQIQLILKSRLADISHQMKQEEQ